MESEKTGRVTPVALVLLLALVARGCVGDSTRACEMACARTGGMESFASTGGCGGAGVCKCKTR